MSKSGSVSVSVEACISKLRTHSLFRQDSVLYDLIPNMPEHGLLPLMQNLTKRSQTLHCSRRSLILKNNLPLKMR
jgi:hypothetical protein